jgi:integrase
LDGEGKRKRKTVYGTTKRDVQDKLDELRGSARVGVVPDSQMRVGVLLEQWLKATAAKRSDRTEEEWQSVVRKHLKPRLGGVWLDHLSALHVSGLYAELAADKVGAHRIRTVADVLGVALNYAVMMRLIQANPAAVEEPKKPKREMLFLDDAQGKALLAAAPGAAVGPLVTVAVATGCRQGELLALGWEDFDPRAGTLSVSKSLAQTKVGPVVKELKTDSSRRKITLPPFAAKVLTDVKAGAMKNGLLAAPVFCTRTGNHLHKKNVLRAFKSLVKRVNKVMLAEREKRKNDGAGCDEPKLIPDGIRFHDLRHTHASFLLSRGCSLRAVASGSGTPTPR